MYRLSFYMYRVSLYMYRVSLYMYRVSFYMYRVSLYMNRVSLYMYRVSLLGPERKSAVIEAQNRELVAWHEGGHAIVALNTPGINNGHIYIERVTSISF